MIFIIFCISNHVRHRTKTMLWKTLWITRALVHVHPIVVADKITTDHTKLSMGLNTLFLPVFTLDADASVL